MIITLTTANSPYNIPLSAFTNQVAQQPAITIYASGGGSVVANLPAISSLPNGYGMIGTFIVDASTATVINCASDSVDVFSNPFSGQTQIITTSGTARRGALLEADFKTKTWLVRG